MEIQTCIPEFHRALQIKVLILSMHLLEVYMIMLTIPCHDVCQHHWYKLVLCNSSFLASPPYRSRRPLPEEDLHTVSCLLC